MANKEHVYAEIEASKELPVLPEILSSLLSACDDPEISLTEIGAIIKRDPSLSLRVLQLVNSAYYGFRHSFGDIGQAVVYLGASTIKNLAVTTSVHQVFQEYSQGHRQDGASAFFWYHSLLTATLARRIAQTCEGCSAEEAYMAGLLHDIGKIVFSSTFGKTYTSLQSTGLTKQEVLAEEDKLFGLTHSELGSWLIKKWRLSPLIADTVKYHHTPIDQVVEAFPLVRYVYLANLLAGEDSNSHELPDLAAKLIDQHEFDFEELLTKAIDEVKRVSDDLGIAVQPPPQPEPTEKPGEDATFLPDKDPSQAARASVTARVRNMSLLFGFQDELMAAENIPEILLAGEKALLLIFGVDNLLFFLPDHDGILLCGQVSDQNTLHEQTSGLALPARQSTSRVVSTYSDQATTWQNLDRTCESLADQQILSMFRCENALAVPLLVGTKKVGVVVMQIPPEWQNPADDERRLLRAVLQQLALRLYLEQERTRKSMELERERQKAISTTSRKLAHEINNPLGIISNYLQALRLELTDQGSMAEEIAIIEEELERISTLVGQMELFAQKPFSHFESLDINSLLQDIIQIVKPSLFDSKGATISFIPGKNLPMLDTAKDAIKQVIINLLKNAAEALDDGGRVVVRTKRVEPEGFSAPGGVEIILADSGPGLPEKVRKNLFQPFITTKQNGHSGLGLSIVQKVVSDIGGRLSCQTSPREGTAFTIRLPVKALDVPTGDS